MTANAAQKFTAEDRLIAFSLWVENNRPEWRELAKLFTAKTEKQIAHTTLFKWAGANEEWSRLIVEDTPIKAERVITALASAKADANKLEPDHFMGIKAQLVARLYDSVKELPLKSVEDWNRGLDCCDRLEALIHTERGKNVKNAGENVVASLMDRLAPNVSLAPFKKPNGAANGSTNGSGGH